MEYFFELMLEFAMCACVVGVVYFAIKFLMSFIPYKQWDRKMDNPPPPPKSKCNSNEPCIRCIGVCYFNPPKETGT